MIKVDLNSIDAVVLVIVKNSNGSYESVTIFSKYIHVTSSDTPYKSHFGIVDIVYSFRSTYKMLNRSNSGFYTGIPLKNETFLVTSYNEAHKIAEEIYKKKKKVHLDGSW